MAHFERDDAKRWRARAELLRAAAHDADAGAVADELMRLADDWDRWAARVEEGRDHHNP